MSQTASISNAAASAPSTDALRLGYAGLLPFVAGAALVWGVRGVPHGFVAQALSAYAALILSFLGGIHWGFGMAPAAPSRRFGWGVTPSLVAWIGLLMRPSGGLVLQGVMFVVCYLVDRRAYVTAGAAPWLTLRFRLTCIAALCCFLGAAGA